ncbi:hotdog domain-containing protein [Ornithinimicrobium sp. LYQ121]|uniref:3-aminobutyryl-CoA ammonia lyase n=1 Tax=Ornithinimicrobium sp. LYQ121 TaxID=3378801 RepID=UPI003854FDEA
MSTDQGPGQQTSRTAQPATAPAAVGMGVTHSRYVPYSHAHYAGNLVDGAYSLALFGDVATELCVRTDGDEGLFASYSDVQFRAPVRAGDCLEVTALLVRVGTRSREMDFAVRVVARGTPEAGVSGAAVLDPPVLATTARGTVIVPPQAVRSGSSEGPRRVESDTPGAREM